MQGRQPRVRREGIGPVSDGLQGRRSSRGATVVVVHRADEGLALAGQLVDGCLRLTDQVHQSGSIAAADLAAARHRVRGGQQ